MKIAIAKLTAMLTAKVATLKASLAASKKQDLANAIARAKRAEKKIVANLEEIRAAIVSANVQKMEQASANWVGYGSQRTSERDAKALEQAQQALTLLSLSTETTISVNEASRIVGAVLGNVLG